VHKLPLAFSYILTTTIAAAAWFEKISMPRDIERHFHGTAIAPGSTFFLQETTGLPHQGLIDVFVDNSKLSL
jgi:hypothetical protein